MKKNRRRSLIAAVSILSALLGTGWFGFRATAGADDAEKTATTKSAEEGEAKGTASVKTVPIRSGEISQSITAYGTVTAQPGEVAVFSVPFECRVRRILVTGGQPIDKGADLIEVEPSADAKLQLLEAKNAVESTSKDLEQTQQRFNMKLATSQELLTSQQNAQLAKMRLESLTQRGVAEGSRRLTAEAAGLVSKVDAQAGQIVPAGGPLIETVARSSIEIRLGVEPSDVSRLHVGQAVRILPVNGGEGSTTDGTPVKVRLITQRVNPETRLVDVFAAPNSTEGLLLDAFVRTELIVETKQALIVPREAVLPAEEGSVLYTVKDGHAVKHVVKVGLRNDKQAEVIADDLKASDAVVIVGNYELEDGMTVTAEPTP